jgi:sugar fermentation stimulation protein A
MKYNKIKRGTFLSRPNRFLADVIIDDIPQRVHVKNTGRCKELLVEGAAVYLEDHEADLRNRKNRYSLVAVEKIDHSAESGIRLVNIDSLAPNKVVAEALQSGDLLLPGLEEGLLKIKPESTFGDSRLDFYIEGITGEKAFIEVKGATLEEAGVARFPDAPTDRGVKHVLELCRAAEQGFFAYIMFIVQMKNVLYFEPNDVTHAAFGEALRYADKKGVQVLAFDCSVTQNSMHLGQPVPVRL